MKVAIAVRIEREELLLLGLSRISRCQKCPRLRAFEIARGRGKSLEIPLPPEPDLCTNTICKPLISRFCKVKRLAPAAKPRD